MNKEKLIAEAIIARNKSYAPYSNIRIGAALQTEDGKIYHGCNIENEVTAVRVCAERTAIFNAFINNNSKIKAIAIIGNTEKPVIPCEFCKLVLLEMCNKDTLILMANLKGDFEEMAVKDINPDEKSKKMLGLLIKELRRNKK
ncbi:cytidine deaminase [Bacillus sp. BB56-3]|nr:cytidine deaminase [Bacillus sp. BB56-3]